MNATIKPIVGSPLSRTHLNNNDILTSSGDTPY